MIENNILDHSRKINLINLNIVIKVLINQIESDQVRGSAEYFIKLLRRSIEEKLKNYVLSVRKHLFIIFRII